MGAVATQAGDAADTGAGVLLHVGYHKTGSTWMQRQLFAREHAGYFYVGRNYQARRHLVRPNALDFRPAEARRALAGELQEAATRGLVPVVSDERLSGNPHSGGFDSKELADRLAAVFPGARVLFVIRRQEDMILSTYDQYVDAGGACSLRDYLAPRTRYAVPSFRLEHLQYHRLIGYYMSLFGVDRVHVLPFELLRSDATSFVREIQRFSGARADFEPEHTEAENRGRPPLLLPVLRRLNPFLVRDDLNGHSILAIPNARYYAFPVLRRLCELAPPSLDRSIRSRLAEHIESACRGVYGESNRHTAELTGLELADLGYQWR